MVRDELQEETEQVKKELLLEDFYIPEQALPFSIGTYDRRACPLHWHHYWEVLYQLDGETLVETDSASYHSMPGDVIVIGAEENHATSKITKTHRLLVMQFELSAIMPYVERISEDQYLAHMMFSNMGEKIHFRVMENLDAIHALLWNINKEYESKKKGYEIQIQAYLLQMFAHFVRHGYIILPEMPEERRQALKKVESSVMYIEQNYSTNITLEEAAGVSSISIYNFCRTFKKATGRTFVEFLNHIRLSEAAKQLLTTDKSISDIALDTGFSSISYFNKIFKKNYGYPPYLYRKENAMTRKALEKS